MIILVIVWVESWSDLSLSFLILKVMDNNVDSLAWWMSGTSFWAPEYLVSMKSSKCNVCCIDNRELFLFYYCIPTLWSDLCQVKLAGETLFRFSEAVVLVVKDLLCLGPLGLWNYGAKRPWDYPYSRHVDDLDKEIKRQHRVQGSDLFILKNVENQFEHHP